VEGLREESRPWYSLWCLLLLLLETLTAGEVLAAAEEEEEAPAAAAAAGEASDHAWDEEEDCGAPAVAGLECAWRPRALRRSLDANSAASAISPRLAPSSCSSAASWRGTFCKRRRR
jgi:hypothetical protein